MDFVCFCHLRWNFVYQRPQHLLSRFAQKYRVFVIEEPLFDAEVESLNIELSKEKVWIITPRLQAGLENEKVIELQQKLLLKFFADHDIKEFIAWYYSPMFLGVTAALPEAKMVVYDCMDELAAFKNAPGSIREMESVLLEKADVVFTGGHTLYEAKKESHPAVFAFPSSIDKDHFANARVNHRDPEDQEHIPHPRIGFFGVLDERLDLELLYETALLKPMWQFVLLGPVVKIDPATLPMLPNIHYLGSKAYDELPLYMSAWDVAMIPFARNESTRFISPTKTPEYLAGGLPVVSTSIRDVVRPYGDNGLVFIGDSAGEFIKGVEWALERQHDAGWLSSVDGFLAGNSWDTTWEKMMQLITQTMKEKLSGNPVNKKEYV